jgi:hypothetical protein
VAVAGTQGVGSSGGDHVQRWVEVREARRQCATGVVDELGVVDEEERVAIGWDVDLVETRADDVEQSGVDHRRRSWDDRAQPGPVITAPDLDRQDAERVGPARSGRTGDEDVVARSHRQADRTEVGIADAHEDNVVAGRHDGQVVQRDVVGQRPDARYNLTWR